MRFSDEGSTKSPVCAAPVPGGRRLLRRPGRSHRGRQGRRDSALCRQTRSCSRVLSSTAADPAAEVPSAQRGEADGDQHEFRGLGDEQRIWNDRPADLDNHVAESPIRAVASPVVIILDADEVLTHVRIGRQDREMLLVGIGYGETPGGRPYSSAGSSTSLR